MFLMLSVTAPMARWLSSFVHAGCLGHLLMHTQTPQPLFTTPANRSRPHWHPLGENNGVAPQQGSNQVTSGDQPPPPPRCGLLSALVRLLTVIIVEQWTGDGMCGVCHHVHVPLAPTSPVRRAEGKSGVLWAVLAPLLKQNS